MKYLGIDYGQQRVGLALAIQAVSTPYRTLQKTTRARLFADLIDIIDREDIDAVVLGLPLDMLGQDTLTTRQVRNFKASLERRISCPVHTVNEALTSFEAASRLREAGISSARQREMLDQIAAVIILENFLGAESL